MKEKELLAKYLPEQVVNTVFQEIIKHGIQLRITRSRKTKLGDFRPPVNGYGPRISVNNDLNPYAFFVTFLHEFAHLLAYEKYRHLKQPHGREWKQIYKEQLDRFLGKDIFPVELEETIKKHMKNIKASIHSDLELTRAFQKYDAHPVLRLEDLQQGDIFIFQQNRKFRILKKVRKRYKCQEINSNRIYLFNALTPVKRHE